MKALVIRQPWAWAIIEGHKRVENRTWRVSHRGPLVIVAGSSTASLARGRSFLRGLGIEPPAELDRSCILGVVTLADIVPSSLCDDRFRRGRLSLFELPASAALQMGNHAASAGSPPGDAA